MFLASTLSLYNYRQLCIRKYYANKLNIKLIIAVIDMNDYIAK